MKWIAGMKQIAGKIAMLAVLALLLMPAMKAEGQSRESRPAADSMSVWQARRTFTASADYLMIGSGRNTYAYIKPNSLRISSSTLEFEESESRKPAHYVLRFAEVAAASATCFATRCDVGVTGGGVLLHTAKGKPVAGLGFFDGAGRGKIFDPGPTCSGRCQKTATDFALAINRMHVSAVSEKEPLQEFRVQAAAWRALATKPALPEEVRLRRLLAEDAIKKNKPEEALNHYEAALELFPTWPQGFFNAAVLAGELGFYADAAEHMQAYLELVPDATDAQSARDQIAIWQYKAKKTSAN